MTFKSEFSLALECCRWNFSGGSTDAIASLAGYIDWKRFDAVVQFHRIQGLVSAGLRAADISGRAANSLGRDAQRIAAENLRVTDVSRTLLGAFEAAGVPLIFLKGLTLGALAYGNPALKSAVDIDLLVAPKDLAKAAAVLRQQNFHLALPQESVGDRTLLKWHRPWKESVWAKGWPRLQLDLHTRVADNPRLIAGIDVHSPSHSVDVGNGVFLPTLSTDELFAYLAVHGASSAWFRLKWISDFAAFIHSAPTDVETLYRRSQKLGAARAAGQALLLSDHLFGTLRSSPALTKELRRDRVTVHLLRTALRLLTADPMEPTERHWGTLPIHQSQFNLRPGFSYKALEFSIQVRRRITRSQ